LINEQQKLMLDQFSKFNGVVSTLNQRITEFEINLETIQQTQKEMLLKS